MRPKVKLAVEKIIALREEFNDKDLAEAVSLISSGRTDDLLTWLKIQRRPIAQKRSVPAKPSHSSKSKALIALRDLEPERYELLQEIDDLIRRGALLPRLEDVRRFGLGLKKDFESGKSRKDAVPRVLAVLADEPLDRMRELAKRLVEEALNASRSGDEYQKLAAFLIHGKPRGKEKE